MWGKRFKQDVLEIKYKGKSLADVLDLEIDEAVEFSKTFRKSHYPLQALVDVGLRLFAPPANHSTPYLAERPSG